MCRRVRSAVQAGHVGIDIEGLYRSHGPMVLRRCRSLLGDEQLANEAMQEVFVQLVRHQHRMEDRGTSSLLWRVATNVCLNLIRSRRRRPEDADDDLITRIAFVDESESRTLAGRILDRLFDQTPESTRTIAVLHLVDGLTLEEVAAAVGMSVSGVRKRLRALSGIATAQEVAA
jgi:RNA polymerase sigma-70 factor (ECF subfamily)